MQDGRRACLEIVNLYKSRRLACSPEPLKQQFPLTPGTEDILPSWRARRPPSQGNRPLYGQNMPGTPSPHFSPVRLSSSDSCFLSIRYDNLLTISTQQTALDAPSLVFLLSAGTCSLNQSYGYTFGRRHPLRAKILRDHRINW